MLAQGTAPISRQVRRCPSGWRLPLVENSNSSPWQCGNAPMLILGSRNVILLRDSREALATCRADAWVALDQTAAGSFPGPPWTPLLLPYSNCFAPQWRDDHHCGEQWGFGWDDHHYGEQWGFGWAQWALASQVAHPSLSESCHCPETLRLQLKRRRRRWHCWSFFPATGSSCGWRRGGGWV